MSVAPKRVTSAAKADEQLVNLNARVPKKLWRTVRVHCLEEGQLLRVFITDALSEHLARRTKKTR